MWAPTQSLYSKILSTLDCAKSVPLARCYIYFCMNHPTHFHPSFPFKPEAPQLIDSDCLWDAQEYDDLVHEFMTATKQLYGEKVLVQVCILISISFPKIVESNEIQLLLTESFD